MATAATSFETIRRCLGALEARAREVWGSPYASGFATVMPHAVFLSVIGITEKAVGEAATFDDAYGACLDALNAQDRALLARTLGIDGAPPRS